MKSFSGPSIVSVAIIAPLILFFVAGMLIDDSSRTARNDVSGAVSDDPDPVRHLALVATRVGLMTLAIGTFWSVYRQSFPLKFDLWSVLVGVAGSALWIGICELQLESALLQTIGLSDDWLGARSGINPFELYNGGQRWLFLVLRFAQLVLLVPIAEELFLRGFLMRAVEVEDWTRLPLSGIGMTGLTAGTLYGVLSHPNEFFAAAVWFSLISFLMVKTGRFWNCVAAHATTNLILGLYILWAGSWHLW